MEKYKICPTCQTKNDPAFIECINCETDLTRVKITDEENEKALEKQEEAKEAGKADGVKVRVCDCGEKNPPNARKCKACGEDISDVPPTVDATASEIEEKKLFVLSSLDGKYAYKVTEDEVTVGRENAMCEYLSEKSYVSRVHARFTVREDGLYVENLNSTNYTFVNNKKITSDVKLSEGDEVGLGGICINGKYQDQAAYFVVKEGKCT